jgi:hypothetical protein
MAGVHTPENKNKTGRSPLYVGFFMRIEKFKRLAYRAINKSQNRMLLSNRFRCFNLPTLQIANLTMIHSHD